MYVEKVLYSSLKYFFFFDYRVSKETLRIYFVFFMTEIFLSQSSIMYFYLFIDDFCNKIPLRLTHIFNVRGHHCKYLHICKIYTLL